MKLTMTNPVLPGFYPDPSACRAGEDYYLITSSFEFNPGLPLFHSRDLVNWKQIGHCLERDSQLPLSRAVTSDGIFASTIRHHDGRFYVVSSNRCAGIGNHFLVQADRPAGPWSDPKWIRLPDGSIPDGLDPSLLFDGNEVYFCCVAWDEQGQGVGMATLDIETGVLKAPLRIIWHGMGDTFPEGPHIYHIGRWYYLLIAEGGTEFGHKVMVARASRVDGPYEPCPDNPILTQCRQCAQGEEIQGVGHGDLVQAGDGSWWMLCHCFRTSIGKLHHLGRETMLLPVTWNSDEWPVVNGTGWTRTETQITPCVAPCRQERPAEETDTLREELHLPWCRLRNPAKENYCCTPDGLWLSPGCHTLDDVGSPTWLGLRQRDFACRAMVTIGLPDAPETLQAGLGVFQTNEHHMELVAQRRGGSIAISLCRRAGDMAMRSEELLLPAADIRLKIIARRESYCFYAEDGDAWRLIGRARTQLMSTETMLYQNFTGTFFCLFAQGSGGAARFSNFSYCPE